MEEQNNDIQRIIKNSEKAELLDALTSALPDFDKAVIVLIADHDDDKENGKYTSLVMTLGVPTTYEAYGILEAGKIDLNDEDNKASA